MVLATSWRTPNDLSPVHTGDYSRRKRRQFVAEFGDSRPKRRLSPNSATVAVFGDSRRIRRQSPFWATVSEFGDSRRFRWQSPNSATIVASVDRTLGFGRDHLVEQLQLWPVRLHPCWYLVDAVGHPAGKVVHLRRPTEPTDLSVICVRMLMKLMTLDELQQVGDVQ